MKLTRLNQLIEEGETLKGRWELDERHEVRYRREGPLEEVTVKASLVEAEPEALVVSVTEKQVGGKIVTSLFKLIGAWQLDDKNRITFEAEREFGKKDVLTFKDSWEVDKNHKLIYTYEKGGPQDQNEGVENPCFQGHLGDRRRP